MTRAAASALDMGTDIRIATSAGQIAASIAGPADAPAVVLLHGGGQTRFSWAGAMRRLVARGYFVLAYDSRGHGESDWARDGDYGIPALAADLSIVLSTLSQPAAIVGASVGGLTSFYAIGSDGAPTATAQVLVDVVSHPTAAGSAQIQAFMSAHQDGFASIEEAAQAVADYNPHRPRPTSPEGLWKNLRKRADGRLYWHWDPAMLNNTPEVVTRQMVGVAAHVRVPTLLVRGSESELVDDTGIEKMLELVPHMEVSTVAGAGHMIAGDRNDAFVGSVLPFLERHHPPG